MAKLQVSEVARSRRGFLTAYKQWSQLPDREREWWSQRREGFIARHMAQYRKHPTYRRWLALIAWAYKPDSRFDRQ